MILSHVGWVACDTVAAIGDQFLDELSARGLVLDQHFVRAELAELLAYRALERGIFEPLAEHGEKEEILAFDPPGRAHREIAQLGRLVGRIPALHDAVKTLRSILLAVILEPFRFYQAAAQRGGRLLVLAGKVVFADCLADAVERVERLALGMQRFAAP